MHRLAADPRDHATGAALARELVRGEGVAPVGVEALPIPAEMTRGALVLVVRRARPRPLFAWPSGADAAIGRTGRILDVAGDRLSCEVAVPGVGRFHAGVASLYAIPDARGESSDEKEVFAEPSSAAATDQGDLGDDGFTELQRALLDATSDPVPLAVHELAVRAGVGPENNRERATASAVFQGLSVQRGSRGLALVHMNEPEFLGGDAPAGQPVAWVAEDGWVGRTAECEAIRNGLPWALTAGVRTGALATPPHDPRELGGALLLLLERPGASLAEVLRVLPGPDFGTGQRGDLEAIRSLYETGRGPLVLRTSFEIELPRSLIVSVPDPGAPPSREALAASVEEAVRASRIDGVAEVQRPLPDPPHIHVVVERGADLLSLRRQLENLLPREREVHYRLPRPLLPWLQAFLDHRRKMGASDADIRRAIEAARPPAPRSRSRGRG